MTHDDDSNFDDSVSLSPNQRIEEQLATFWYFVILLGGILAALYASPRP